MGSTLAPNDSRTERDVRLGLVGAGRWGQAYIRTLTGCDGISLARIASQNPKTKSLVPASCTISTDWHDLIVADNIDGIIIATPPASHAKIALAAIEQGRAIMVEKPLTLSLHEAEHLLEATEEHQAVVLVDHTHLFHPAYDELKHQLSQVGPIREIRTCTGRIGPFRKDTPVLWDWAPHDIAMCLDIMNQSPKNIKAVRTQSRRFPEGIGERFEISLEFGKGVIAHIKIGNDFSKKMRQLTAATDSCELVYDDCATNPLVSRSLLSTQPEKPQVIEVSDELPLKCALYLFANRIRNNVIETDSIRLGVEVVLAISRCQDLISSKYE